MLEGRLADWTQNLGMRPQTCCLCVAGLLHQLSLSQVGAMFLRTPSLLHKNPSTLAHKAAAFKALPGLNPQHAQEAISRMPSLLNLDPNRLKRRWQWLQEVGGGHAWHGRQCRCC